MGHWSEPIKLYLNGEYVVVQQAISYSLENMDQTFGEHVCHPEPFASLKGKLREGSGSTDAEILRCAQDDSQGGESWIRCKVGWVKVLQRH